VPRRWEHFTPRVVVDWLEETEFGVEDAVEVRQHVDPCVLALAGAVRAGSSSLPKRSVSSSSPSSVTESSKVWR